MTARRLLSVLKKHERLAILQGGCALTLLLGGAVAFGWMVFGFDAWHGPDRAVSRSWPLIYGAEAIVSATLTAVLVVKLRPGPTHRQVVGLVLAGWLGELVALTLGGNLLANEIDPEVAWMYWWMATAGPVQPAVALLAAFLALGWRRGLPALDGRG